MVALTAMGNRSLIMLVALANVIKAGRRYPVLPITVLMLVLILPSALANAVAPHDPIKADLVHRLEPPAWIGPKVIVKTVSERRTTKDLIPIRDVHGLKTGSKTGQTRHPDPQSLVVGDQLEITERGSGSWARPLGTDKLGRDLVSRMIHGARYSLYVAIAVIGIAGVVGTILGMTAGYFGGWIDYLISRIIDVFMSLPGILVLLVLVVVIGPGLLPLIAVISGLLWSNYARLVRGEVLTIKSSDYIARARVAGASPPRIMLRHVFPNVVNSLVVLATLQVGFVIIIEASASFLGAGIPRPTPSWGSIVADGRDLIIEAGWWVSVFSGLAIMLTVMSVNLLGDWLRDELDPKLRQIWRADENPGTEQTDLKNTR